MRPNPRIRIPFTGPAPSPIPYPANASTLSGLISALSSFLHDDPGRTAVLTGAGISVASGLSDYRGAQGTYRRNPNFRPIYFGEFVGRHKVRQRYWARSFVGWPAVRRARANVVHECVEELRRRKLINGVVTQNVDSFHLDVMSTIGRDGNITGSSRSYPQLQQQQQQQQQQRLQQQRQQEGLVELHGYLRAVVCVKCGGEVDRDEFQQQLGTMNPRWEEFLERAIEAGAFEPGLSEEERAVRSGFRMNADGDVDLGNDEVKYSTFQYPQCAHCASGVGILKPGTIMFGESVKPDVRVRAEEMIDGAEKLLILGSSLATLSAYRLVERAMRQGKGIGIVNVGGVRHEDVLFREGMVRVRSGGEWRAEDVIPAVTRS
ncbi:hypothetical protein KEM55_000228 [Ascosphaera atra]|nr:hypothetical protein KEM55_000228 [Ascosphaera atra]